MKNILKSEIYKLKNSSYYWIINVSIAVVIIFYCVYLRFFNDMDRVILISNSIPSKFNLIINVLMIFSFIYQEEYQYDTLKNSVILTGNKTSIFFGKQIVQSLIVILSYTMVLLLFLLSILVFKKGSDYSFAQVESLVIYFAILIPIILRALAFLNVITILGKNDYVIFAVYLIIVNFSDIFLSLASSVFQKLEFLREYTIQSQVNQIIGMNMNGNEIVKTLVVNLGVFTLYSIMSVILYKRSEV
ncbi:ABC transporter permease [Clostridium cellulovorans]|uniref:ABC-2 family transporter protein n=1 Tax=Clostridium cellulovorans (strain ATCC 35296 / DSM 3052 / OCM 3 / 743B) TaxID=573061 RepID=D9SN88_CLOC7|nr:ABC transporter permease [Clostridium cellulovorans]ADL53880.1 hypothetical protein Clocel_4219 [Clostridium cellulovorans 743B]